MKRSTPQEVQDPPGSLDDGERYFPKCPTSKSFLKHWPELLLCRAEHEGPGSPWTSSEPCSSWWPTLLQAPVVLLGHLPAASLCNMLFASRLERGTSPRLWGRSALLWVTSFHPTPHHLGPIKSILNPTPRTHTHGNEVGVSGGRTRRCFHGGQ